MPEKYLIDFYSLTEVAQKHLIDLLNHPPLKLYSIPRNDIQNLIINEDVGNKFFYFLSYHKNNLYYNMRYLSDNILFIVNNPSVNLELIFNSLAEDFSVNRHIFDDDKNSSLMEPVLVNYIRNQLLKENLTNNPNQSKKSKTKI